MHDSIMNNIILLITDLMNRHDSLSDENLTSTLVMPCSPHHPSL